ncbi:MAG: 6-hydroxymethylpterin diphosphokinase MptE-like protein [Halioglobus sp.]
MSVDAKNPLLSVPAVINPYRTSAILLKNRLLWDLRPESWRSRRKIRKWHNKYIGEKAVIVCNGPSLLETNLDLLEGVFTFGLNKIDLLFDKSSFRPSCIVAVNEFVIEQNTGFYNATEIPLFLDSIAMRRVTPKSNIAYLHSSTGLGFAQDCSMSILQGHTVTFVAMQIAFHMGFQEVALIGCDHSFADSGPANAVGVSGKTDTNHFDPNYFAGGTHWNFPDLFESEVAYTRAKNMYQAHGRKLINATEGGKLDLFERSSLLDFVQSTD